MILQKLQMGRLLGRHAKRGFTLVELAIVLAVATTLFAGLWRLMASGSTQLRDQSVAEQHRQVMGAVRNFLKSADGQSHILANHNVADKQWELILPTVNDGTLCTTVTAATPTKTFSNQVCKYFPVGFDDATENSYGQTYRVLVNNGPGAAPVGGDFAFAVISEGGDDIPDVSGGRISALIGSDGGFIYSTDVCGAPAASNACGAYGTWNLFIGATAKPFDVATILGAALLDVGHVMSRTEASQSNLQLGPWLARDATLGTTYNTMSTNLLFNAAAVAGTTSGRDINLNGNLINLLGGRIIGLSTLGTAPQITTNAITNVRYMKLSMGGVGVVEVIPALKIEGATDAWHLANDAGSICAKTEGAAGSEVPGAGPDCPYAVSIDGNMYVSKTVVADNLIAGSFVYTSSDARLKHDIQPIQNALAKIGALKGVSFAFNKDNQKGMGVIAQELEKVYPQLVKDRGDGYKAVDYMGLIAPMIEAIKELKKENEVLRLDLDAVKGRLDKKSTSP